MALLCSAVRRTLTPLPFLGVSSLNLGRLAKASRPLSFSGAFSARRPRARSGRQRLCPAIQRLVHEHEIHPSPQLETRTRDRAGVDEAEFPMHANRARIQAVADHRNDLSRPR